MKDQIGILNELQSEVLDIYTKLGQFSEHDVAGKARSGALDLVDEIGAIRRRLLQNDKPE